MKNSNIENTEEIILRLKNIERIISIRSKHLHDVILCNKEFLQVMNISQRTAQYWRKKGIIGYIEIGTKIYYKLKDVEELINVSYHKEEN